VDRAGGAREHRLSRGDVEVGVAGVQVGAPVQPRVARRVGQQVLLLESVLEREPLRPFAHQEDVVGVLEDALGDLGRRLDPLETPHRSQHAPREPESLGFTRRARRCQLAHRATRFYVPRVSPELSLVVPVFNERENLAPLLLEIAAALRGTPYEVVAVDDGSTDGSLDELKHLKGTDVALRIVSFERNSGQTAAFAAGFKAARGATIVTLDADLQND